MVILRSQNKITDFLIILAWASPFKLAGNGIFDTSRYEMTDLSLGECPVSAGGYHLVVHQNSNNRTCRVARDIVLILT